MSEVTYFNVLTLTLLCVGLVMLLNQRSLEQQLKRLKDQSDSHHRNNQTAVTLLTDRISRLIRNNYAELMNAHLKEFHGVTAVIKTEHKKTRKETQELKTGNEWAKKREHQMIEKLDKILERPQIQMTASNPQPNKAAKKPTKTKAVK